MDKETFCNNVKEYSEKLYFIAWAILKNEKDSEDAVEEAILLAYEHLDQLKKPESFKAWISKITKNETLKIKKKRLTLLDSNTVETLSGSHLDKYEEFSDILQQLPEKFRLVIVLFYYDELSLKEISKVLSVPVGTVKSRLSRAKKMLRDILERGRINE